MTFLINEAIEGGYNARSQHESIFTQADTIEELNINIADAISCHFDDEILPDFVLQFI